MLYRFALDNPIGNPIGDFTTLILEAFYRIPGVRFVLGLASPEWRPFWALTWVIVLVYVSMRIIESAQRVVVQRQLAAQASRGGHPIGRPIELVSRRSGTLDPAGGEFMDGTDDLTIVDAPTPKPATTAPDDQKRGPHARATRAALVAGLVGCVVLLLGTIGGDEVADEPSDGLVALPGTPPAAGADDPAASGAAAEPPFAFAARSWRSVGGACVATLEVTAGSADPRTLTMYVMDASGGILAKDQIRVASLTPKAFHEFRFPGVDCGAITEWQVQGVLGRQ